MAKEPTAPASGADTDETGTTPPPEPGPSAAPGPRVPPPGSPSGFFDWLRSLGVPRQPGWIGGVCSGIAARLGIDPLIVRGVLVVFALFGAPAFVLYGAAWLLLPDLSGRIHLEQLLRGVFDNAIIGISLFLLAGFIPLLVGVPSYVGGMWSSVLAGNFWTGAPWFVDIIGVIWGLLVLGAAAAFIVWLVRRSGTTAGSAPYTYIADETGYQTYTAAQTTTTTTDAPTDTAAEPTPAEPDASEPVKPGPDAGVDAYAEWKLRHEAWRIEHQEWRQAQTEANRAARAQLAADNRVRAAAFAAQAEEARRIRKLTRPRTSFAYVVATLGLALVVSALAGIAALTSPSTEPYAGTIGLCAATIVTALSMVLAGALRRRSGFLSAVTIVMLVLSLGAAAVPRTDRMLIGSQGVPADVSASYFQPFGDVYIDAFPANLDPDRPAHIEITQGAGNVYVTMHEGTQVALDVTYASGWSSVTSFTSDDGDVQTGDLDDLDSDDDGVRYVERVGPGGAGGVDLYVTVRGASGGISVTTMEN